MTTSPTLGAVPAATGGGSAGAPYARSPHVGPTHADPLRSGHSVGLAGGRDVHLVDVSVGYERNGRTHRPVSGLHLYAPTSRVTALVGPSGSGKTSILSCIAGTLRPAGGTIWLGGIDVTSLRGRSLDHYRRTHVGVVHQAYNLLPSLTAAENVVVPLRLAGCSRRAAQARSRALLDELGIASLADVRPGAMSGGQQQRVAVARALASNPSVVLADEPTAHLDGSSVDDVRRLLRSIAESGRTVIVSTHDDRLLGAVDQVLPLSGGA